MDHIVFISSIKKEIAIYIATSEYGEWGIRYGGDQCS